MKHIQLLKTLIIISFTIHCSLFTYSQPVGAIKIATGCASISDFWVAPTDDNGGSSIAWASNSTTSFNSTSLIDGRANTTAQVTNGGGGGAFGVCQNKPAVNGKNWYLPSIGEMLLMHQRDIPLSLSLGLIAQSYWSSTEATTSGAWVVRFKTSGLSDVGPKTETDMVRCVWRP